MVWIICVAVGVFIFAMIVSKDFANRNAEWERQQNDQTD